MSVIVMEGSNGAGKTTIIKNLYINYDFISMKSVPDWYRKYIPFARSLNPELQKKVYMIGHEANYLSLDSNKDYIFDRFYYSTIIRLNYELKKSVFDTVNEILEIQMLPDMVIYLNANKKYVLNRLIQRDNFTFDNRFFEYENTVFNYLTEKCDKMITVNNDSDIEFAVNEIVKRLGSKNIFLKRR